MRTLLSLQGEDALVIQDARAYWPGRNPHDELARAVVRACLKMADGESSCNSAKERITASVHASAIGVFLSERHPGVLAAAKTRRLQIFLRKPQQSRVFVLRYSANGSCGVALNLDAPLRGAARSLVATAQP